MNEIMNLSPRLLDILRVLYENENITQKELSFKLNNSCAATSNLISKILQYYPPLIHKEVWGKYRYYSLTDYGKKYYERCFNKDSSEEIKMSPLEKITASFILDNFNPNGEDFLAYGLKKLGVDIICDIFTMQEFLYLCLILGIITNPMSVKDAIKLAMPSINGDNYLEVGRIVYQKLKSAIGTYLLGEFESKVFNNSDNKNIR